jgi:hypothetical protein
MHKVESITSLVEVSTDVFMILHHESIFIADKGLTWTT